MFRISNNNHRGSSLAPKPTSGLDQQTQSYMDSLEQIIRAPLQELTLDQITQDPEGFNSNCSGAKEYLGQLRLEAKETKDSKNMQGRGDLQPSPVCKHLLGVLKVFVEESLVEILNKWENLLSSGSMKFNEAGPFLQVTLIGLEMMRSAVAILQGALGKKQKVWDEMTKLSSVFRSLNEIVITKPSLTLLGESQMVCGDADQSELMQLLDRIYKAIWGITFMLKKQNLLADLSDNLLNTMEIAFIEMIDSDQIAQNILGYEILTNMLYLTDNEYYLSLVNVVSNWHKKYAINNIGKLYQILFLAANEATRERILWEVERLEPEELYKFLQVFDSKMYEGYFEGGLLFQDENTIVPKPSLLIEKMGLTQKLVTKLQDIMDKRVCDDLLKTTQSLKNKNSPLYQQNQKRFISLMKIASVSVNSSLFFYGPNSLKKIHESLLHIIEDILTNSTPNEIHYVQLQGIIDVFHGMFKGMNPDQFEMIVDTISKSGNVACEMFAAKFGSILPHMNYDNIPQDRILAKLGNLYNTMLQSDDALSKCKAVEGIMLAANHATVDDITVIIPPEDEGKTLLRKVGNPGQEDEQKMTKEIADEMLGTLGGRLASVLEKHKISMEKFANIQREYGFDIGSNGLGRDDDLESAFKKIEECILKLKEAETQPQNEYKKLQLRNKVNSLLDMCDPSAV